MLSAVNESPTEMTFPLPVFPVRIHGGNSEAGGDGDEGGCSSEGEELLLPLRPVHSLPVPLALH